MRQPFSVSSRWLNAGQGGRAEQAPLRKRLPRTAGLLVLALLLTAALSCRPFGGKRGGLAPGEKAPRLQAAGWLNGKPPEDLRGKVVVVEAWASWCEDCHASAPEMVRTYHKYHPQGVVFVGLTGEEKDRLSEIEAFLKKYEIPWPNGYGSMDTLNEFQAGFIPAVWVIGRDGIVLWNADSEKDESLEDAIDRALAAK